MTIGALSTIRTFILMENRPVKRLNTWLPIGVFEELTNVAKQVSGTAMGKWDYGVTINIILAKARYFDMLYNVLEPMNKRIEELESKLEPKEKPVNPIPQGFYEAKTLADRKHNLNKQEEANHG